MSSKSAEKRELRKQFRASRHIFIKTVTPKTRESFATHLSSVISESVQKSGAGVWGSFRARDGEADPQDAEVRLGQQVRWAYPRVEAGRMEFWIPRTAQSWVETDHFFRNDTRPVRLTEPEPRSSDRVSVQDMQGVLVPGVAFDEDGVRLGSGMGFYDRALEGFTGRKIGLAWSAQVSVDPLPREAHDLTVDAIVTETGVLHC